MKMQRSVRTKLAALSVAGTFVLAACGGAGGGNAEPASQLPTVADDVALRPEADIATNLLPDLIVDNLNDDNKVNLKNIVPSDRPIVLWMWAPH